MSNTLLSLILAVAAPCAIAQSPLRSTTPPGPPPPPGYLQQIPTPRPGEIVTSSLADLPPETQRMMALRAPIVDANGVSIFEADDNYVHMLDTALTLAKPTRNEAIVLDQFSAAASWQFLGYVHDAPNLYRSNRMWRDDHGRLVMLMEWDYKKAGGGQQRFKELLTENVRGQPAQMVLSRTPNSDAALWGVSWATERKIYELQVAEPDLPPASVIAHKQEVLGYANSIGN